MSMNNTESIELDANTDLYGTSEDDAFDLSALHQDKFFCLVSFKYIYVYIVYIKYQYSLSYIDIIIGGIFMAIIICSCVCCLLIYVICILKNSTKQIIYNQSLQSQISVHSKSKTNTDKSMTGNTSNCNPDHCNQDQPTFQNPVSESCSNTIRPNKICIHDKMISNDWKLTVNDLHRFSTKHQHDQIPIESNTKSNQPSPTCLPVTPIPTEINEMKEMNDMKLDEKTEEEEIEEKPVKSRKDKLDTMIENSLSDDDQSGPWKYFQHSESKHSTEEKEERAYTEKGHHERDESEELDIIKDGLESTFTSRTKTIDYENMILGPNMKLTSSKLDKLSKVCNINTMTNIDEYGIDDLQIEFSMKSIDSNDDDDHDINKMTLRKKHSSKSNSYFVSMNKQPTNESQYLEADENDDRNYINYINYPSPKGSFV